MALVVSLLCVHAAHQRKGLGSMLLKHGLALADAEGKKTYIEASETGHPLYLKFGWKDIDLLSIDAAKWGVKQAPCYRIMTRDPQPPQL